MDGWISSLVQQAMTTTTTTTTTAASTNQEKRNCGVPQRRGSAVKNCGSVPSRKESSLVGKAPRRQTKPGEQLLPTQLLHQHQQLRRAESNATHSQKRPQTLSNHPSINFLTNQQIQDLAVAVQNAVARYDQTINGTGKVLTPFQTTSRPKARTRKKLWDPHSIQPRHRDYSGIGLARPSLYLELTDPALIPKLEEEFAEHITGFYGKQRTKAVKKQQAGTMLWRQLVDKRNLQQTTIRGRKLSEMSPDERVEAMIQAGMI